MTRKNRRIAINLLSISRTEFQFRSTWYIGSKWIWRTFSTVTTLETLLGIVAGAQLHFYHDLPSGIQCGEYGEYVVILIQYVPGSRQSFSETLGE